MTERGTDTGLLIEGTPATPEDVARIFADAAESAQSQHEPEPVSGSPGFEAAFDAPNTDGNSGFADFRQFDMPRTNRQRKALGPDDKDELAEFFTQDGIGSIVARGLNAFFVSCDAEPMTQAESNNVAKVTAYYCRARLPSGAGAYQPELLLFATLAMAVLPRLGPITEKTAPFWRRAWEWLKRGGRKDE